MVSLNDILESNARITTLLPKGIVAVFAGATTGIGETTLKTFVKYASEPRIYLLARSVASAERVIAECRQNNNGGTYNVVKVDLSSVKETNEACEEIKAKEKHVNLIFLSAGEITLGTKVTSEGLNFVLAASTYSRIRIAQQLLPLLIVAAQTSNLARVIDVAAGTKEGSIDTSDLAATRLSLALARGHLSSMHTLALEELARQAPQVSFVHDFPGAVYTSMHKDLTGFAENLFSVVFDVLHFFLGRWFFVPIEECGERHVFLATSNLYKPRTGTATGVPFVNTNKSGIGSNGESNSGVYSVDWDCEGPKESARNMLESLRSKGIHEAVWDHFIGEFDRICGASETLA